MMPTNDDDDDDSSWRCVNARWRCRRRCTSWFTGRRRRNSATSRSSWRSTASCCRCSSASPRDTPDVTRPCISSHRTKSVTH